MTFEKGICEVCGCDYEYDTEAAPSYCELVCSQGCNERQILLEQNSCDDCLKLKVEGIIPAVCQYHLDMQFKSMEVKK